MIILTLKDNFTGSDVVFFDKLVGNILLPCGFTVAYEKPSVRGDSNHQGIEHRMCGVSPCQGLFGATVMSVHLDVYTAKLLLSRLFIL